METIEAIEVEDEGVGISKREPKGIMRCYILLLGTAMCLFHLYTAYFGLLQPLDQRSVHAAFILAAGFYIYPLGPRYHKGKWLVLDFVAMAVGACACLYMTVFSTDIMMRPARPADLDLVVSAVAIVMFLELCRRTMGPVLSLVTLFFILYGLFGAYLPWIFKHPGVSLRYLLYFLYNTPEGIWGIPMGVSAKYVFLFIIFGAMVVKAGTGEVIIDITKAVAGRARGGPAKIAVLASALFGSISGSAVANVVSTGSFTIPMMKKLGFKPEFAGGVEAVASTGGVIMPPIMGAAAFVMADMMGVTYLDVVKAAWLPACLYYVALIVMVHLRAVREGLRGLEESGPGLSKIIIHRGYLLLPVFILTYLLLVEKGTPMYGAFWTIVALFVISYFKRQSRLTPIKLLECFEYSLKVAISLVAGIGCAGIIMGVVLVTGLALQMSTILITLAHGSLFLLMALTAVACLILGMGVTATVSYIIPSILVVPTLIKFGVSPMTANLFCLYFATIAYITPPVALASFAAAGIADADMMKTGYKAFGLGISGFLIPFMFVYRPALIMEGSWPAIMISIVASVLGVSMLGVAIEGLLFRNLYRIERLLCVITALLLIFPGWITDVLGFLFLGIIIAAQKLIPGPGYQMVHGRTELKES